VNIFIVAGPTRVAVILVLQRLASIFSLRKVAYNPNNMSEAKESTKVAAESDNSDPGTDVDAVRERILLEQQLQKSEPPALPISTLWRRKEHKDLQEIATQPSVFDDPETAKYFQPTPKYENLHRFDPSARWTWAEELPLINKIDWKITTWACIAFFALDLDRGNLSQANTDSFLKDLKLSTNGLSIPDVYFEKYLLCRD